MLDTVEGFLRGAQAEGALGEEINLGNDATISIGELCELIFSILGKSPKIVTESQRKRPEKSEVLRLQASYKKAKSLLDWEPKVSLEAGLRKTAEWIAAHLDIYKPDQYTV